jgi:hypothetical protein
MEAQNAQNFQHVIGNLNKNGSLLANTCSHFVINNTGVPKMCTHFKRCYLRITFRNWIELR